MRAALLSGACVIALAAVGARPARAADPAFDVRGSLAPKAREAFDLLLAAPRFESAYVGEGGSLSRYAAAVRTLIREREAPAAFQILYERGSAAAALYALAAFWYLRPGDFPALVEGVRARHGTTQLQIQMGCIGGRDAVATLLERPAPRRPFRLSPGTGRYAFMCAMRKGGSYTDDFVGGGYPIQIVEGTMIEDRRCAHPPPLPDYLKPRG
jgi:hypothetical protein